MMVKLNFQQSVLQSSVSHDPSEIICAANAHPNLTKADVLCTLLKWK